MTDAQLSTFPSINDRARLVDPAFALLVIFFGSLYSIFIARTTFFHSGELVGTLFDDALISLRYAHNLSSGFGLVWNPGETPPVEGYTNPLWTLIMSATFFVAPQLKAPIVVAAIGGMILLLSGYVTLHIARSVNADSAITVASVITVLSYFPNVYWTLRGMEVGLVSLLLLAAIALVLNAPPGPPAVSRLACLSLLAGLSFLTRPDSIILFAPAFFLLLFPPHFSVGRVLALLPLALCVGAQLIFRLSYYGEFAPNTYVLKMTGTPILERLAHGVQALLFASPALYVASIIVASAFRHSEPWSQRWKLALLAISCAIIQSCYLVWVGGDAWNTDNSNRFLATTTPLLLIAAITQFRFMSDDIQSHRVAQALISACIVSGIAALVVGNYLPTTKSNVLAILGATLICLWLLIARWFDRKRSPVIATWVACLALFLLCSAPAWARWLVANAPAVQDDIAAARKGLFLKDVFPPNTTIAATWLGAPSYFSNFTSYDIYGKVDKYIAKTSPVGPFRPGHNKMDLDYTVGELKPDVVLYSTPQVGRYGYVFLRNTLWVRAPFFETIKHNPRLQDSWCLSPNDSFYCPK